MFGQQRKARPNRYEERRNQPRPAPGIEVREKQRTTTNHLIVLPRTLSL
jgi:hypothetical protein